MSIGTHVETTLVTAKVAAEQRGAELEQQLERAEMAVDAAWSQAEQEYGQVLAG